MVYFDNAATTYPKPRSTREALDGIWREYGANPGRGGHKMALDTSLMVYSARERLSDMFGLNSPEWVIFTLNCTMALNIAIKGAAPKGGHVVISSLEHNSVLRPVEALKRQGLIDYSIADIDINSPEKTAENFTKAMRGDTRLVVLIHGSNVFGSLQDAKAIADIAHRGGALFLLDAAQTGGVLPIDINAVGADFIALALHKGLFAPAALGALLINCDMVLETIFEGGSGSLSALPEMPENLPERLEAGTVNTAGILGLLGGLRFIRSCGVEAIHAQEMLLTNRIYSGLMNIPGVVCYNRPQLPVLSFNIEGRSGEYTAGRLSDMGFYLRGGLHCSPLAHKSMGTADIGTARISPGFFNSRREADGLLLAVQALARAR